MKSWSSRALGGLCLGLLLAGCGEPRAPLPPRAPGPDLAALPPGLRIAPDAGGPIREWILYAGDLDIGYFVDTVTALIAATHTTSGVRVVYSEARSRQVIEARLRRRGFEGFSRLRWQETAGGINWWARDHFVLAEDRRGRPHFLLHHPAHYRGLEVYPDRVGRPAMETVVRLAGKRAVRTRACLEGGAIVADADRVLISGRYLDFGVDVGAFESSDAVLAYLSALYGRPVAPLAASEGLPSRHLDLLLSLAGDGNAVLGDPELGLRLLDAVPGRERKAFGAAVTALAKRDVHDAGQVFLANTPVLPALREACAAPEVRRAFAEAAAQLRGLGYRVHRVPWLGFDATIERPLVLSWNNVVVERRREGARVYMPVYGLSLLDDAAAEVWASLGYEVIRIPSLGPGLRAGAVRCLSQTLRGRPAV